MWNAISFHIGVNFECVIFQNFLKTYNQTGTSIWIVTYIYIQPKYPVEEDFWQHLIQLQHCYNNFKLSFSIWKLMKLGRHFFRWDLTYGRIIYKSYIWHSYTYSIPYYIQTGTYTVSSHTSHIHCKLHAYNIQYSLYYNLPV